MSRFLPNAPTRVALTALALAFAGTTAGAQTVAITGGTVYPVSGPAIPNGTVLVRDGRIVAVGANVSVPADAQRIDATGKVVTPGFVNAGTQLGVYEIGAVQTTGDARAAGRDGIAAAFVVADGFNPRSNLLAITRNDGVTSALVLPQGGLIAGQASFVDLAGARGGTDARAFVRRPSAAMVAQLGPWRGPGVASRGELIARLREVLQDARAYATRRADYEANRTRDLAARRADLEALQPVLQGRLPMIVAADRASDIEAALRLARDFGLRLVIGGGAEAWQVADQLAAARVPVMTGAMNSIPGSFAELGQRQENAALLARAGVPVVLIGNAGGGDEEAFNVRNIRYEAGNAVAYGMPWEQALRAVTLAPAEAFGVAAQVGSLAPGREANLVVWSGDPFEFTSVAERVMIGGRDVRTDTRQEMLARRYRTLPPAPTQP